MAEDEDENKPGMLTAEQAGQLIMVSGERVRQLSKQGFIQKVGHGKFPLVSVVQGYIKFLRDDEKKNSKVAADAKVREMKAKEIEQRIAERNKELVHIDDVNAVVSDFVATVRAEIVGISARITRDPDDRRRCENVINDILNRISERQSQTARALSADGFADEAIADDTA